MKNLVYVSFRSLASHFFVNLKNTVTFNDVIGISKPRLYVFFFRILCSLNLFRSFLLKSLKVFAFPAISDSSLNKSHCTSKRGRRAQSAKRRGGSSGSNRSSKTRCREKKQRPDNTSEENYLETPRR